MKRFQNQLSFMIWTCGLADDESFNRAGTNKIGAAEIAANRQQNSQISADSESDEYELVERNFRKGSLNCRLISQDKAAILSHSPLIANFFIHRSSRDSAAQKLVISRNASSFPRTTFDSISSPIVSFFQSIFFVKSIVKTPLQKSFIFFLQEMTNRSYIAFMKLNRSSFSQN